MNYKFEEKINTKHLIKTAFDKGFKAFQRGNYFDNPFRLDTWAGKEWQRGQNAAYAMYLERNKQREEYRDGRS